MEWKKLEVKMQGEYLLARKEYLREDKRAYLSNAKTIQVNASDVYVIGGHEQDHSLLAKPYHVPTSCLQINVETGELFEKQSMTHSRRSFGLCNIRHFIYVIGFKCERFDVINGKWSELERHFQPSFITAVPIR